MCMFTSKWCDCIIRHNFALKKYAQSYKFNITSYNLWSVPIELRLLPWVYNVDFRYIAVIHDTIVHTAHNLQWKASVRFAPANDTLYIAFTGELWGVLSYKEKWQLYIEIVLHRVCWLKIMYRWQHWHLGSSRVHECGGPKSCNMKLSNHTLLFQCNLLIS